AAHYKPYCGLLPCGTYGDEQQPRRHGKRAGASDYALVTNYGSNDVAQRDPRRWGSGNTNQTTADGAPCAICCLAGTVRSNLPAPGDCEERRAHGCRDGRLL